MGRKTCGLCGSRLSSRQRHSLQRVWAWWWAGVIFYIPANLYPMLKTTLLGHETSSTIVGGVIDLVHHGSYFVAAVVFFASVMIPVGKFVAIAYLAYIIRRGGRIESHSLHQLHVVVEFIGRWSMIDVFVVAMLSALVHLSFVVNIAPGIAAICFALSVVFTMLSALSFDPRVIYDAAEVKG
ncbi:MAG: paraquat-inducible protein A [Pseudomonadota bacterium]